MSKLTFWPSFRVRMPAASTAETCTNTSLPPPSGEMKPKPLAELKNFTVPMVINLFLLNIGFRPREMRGRPWKQEHQVGGSFSVRPARPLKSEGWVRKTEALRLTGTQEPRRT